jgi:hypothetical protein
MLGCFWTNLELHPIKHTVIANMNQVCKPKSLISIERILLIDPISLKHLFTCFMIFSFFTFDKISGSKIFANG